MAIQGIEDHLLFVLGVGCIDDDFIGDVDFTGLFVSVISEFKVFHHYFFLSAEKQ